MANNTGITGWDIGGAHLKVARLDGTGRLLYVEQFATPLWLGLERLDAVLAAVRDRMGLDRSRHVLTMTAELADCFRDRQSGVDAILDRFTRVFPAGDCRVYAGRDGFVSITEAGRLQDAIASANWLASAEYLAGLYRDGIFVDIGSTTTDIIPFCDGRPAPMGRTDHERLRSGELVYTGVVRTPVMAVVGKVPFRGRRQAVAAENFATMADVYRLTGRLQAHHDLMEPADGGGKTKEDSVRRLARMVGLDPDPGIPEEAWLELAEYIATQQRMMITEAIHHIKNRAHRAHPHAGTVSFLIGAGCGRFLIPALIQAPGWRIEDFADHLNTDPSWHDKAGNNASAVALAQLAFRTGV